MVSAWAKKAVDPAAFVWCGLTLSVGGSNLFWGTGRGLWYTVSKVSQDYLQRTITASPTFKFSGLLA
jgi:hypothetical protein